VTVEAMEDAPAPFPAELARIRLWDLPVRVVHWSFALLLPALWWTWQAGQMPAHRLLGYAMLALLLFRIYWGLVGSASARFAAFVKGPRAIAAYARTLFSHSAEPVVGHNPLGAWSVVALLASIAAQIALGLFAQDLDGLESGPLAAWVTYEQADSAREWHRVIFYVLLGFTVLHLCAVAFYLLVKRDNLVAPMITGRKRLAGAAALRFAPFRRVVPGALASIAATWWIALGCPFPG
jgi:cytochrome b